MTESARRRQRQPSAPALDPTDPLSAFTAGGKIRSLDEVARAYPRRDLTLGRERQPVSFYSSRERPNAFAMTSLEFLFLIAQFYREALPLRLILLLIACQRAGGEIHLTQNEMATVLDVPRPKANMALGEVMGHGIVFRPRRGVYQFNPPYSYVAAELLRFADGTTRFVEVPQVDVLEKLRNDTKLPELVRFPSLEHMRQAVEEMREERAKVRAERRAERAQMQEGEDQ